MLQCCPLLLQHHSQLCNCNLTIVECDEVFAGRVSELLWNAVVKHAASLLSLFWRTVLNETKTLGLHIFKSWHADVAYSSRAFKDFGHVLICHLFREILYVNSASVHSLEINLANVERYPAF